MHIIAKLEKSVRKPRKSEEKQEAEESIFQVLVFRHHNVDGQNINHKDCNFKLRMSKDGKRSIINVQEEVKYPL